MLNKKLFLNLFFIILFSLVILFPSFGLEETKGLIILNSTGPDSLKAIIYEVNEIDLDSSFITWYILSKNESFYIELKNENEFVIWNLEIDIDNKPHLFIPKPLIEKRNNVSYFNHSVKIDGTHLIKVSFWVNNVMEKVSHEWYPFDSYSVFLMNRTLTHSISNVAYFKFPETDIGISFQPQTTSKIKTAKLDIPVSASQHIMDITKYSRISNEVWIQNGQLSNMKIDIYKRDEYGNLNSKKVLLDDSINNEYRIILKRTFFPSILLFFLMGGYVIFLTFYSIQEETILKEKVYQIYIKSSLPFVFAELIVGILPPSRPFTFTLFDSIICWPLGILLIKFIKEEYVRQYPNLKNKSE